MSGTSVQVVVDRFLGLNDRDHPAQLSPFECADLRNVELGDGIFARRNGYSRVNSTPFYDTAVRLNGDNEYFRINHDSAYAPTGSDRFFFSIDILPRATFDYDSAAVTAGDRVVAVKGYGTSSNLEWRLMYDVSLFSNAGGWKAQAWDTASGGALKEWTVSDPGQLLLGAHRHLEFGWFDTGYELRVYTSTGTLIGSDTTADITTWNATSQPIFVGVDMTAADTPDTDQYLAATLAEARLCIFSSSTYSNGAPISQEIATGGVLNPPRELNPRLGEEASFLKGYWKFNDGTGNTAVDTGSESNNAEMASAGPSWTFDRDHIIGASALRYYGEQGHLHWSWDQTEIDSIFNPPTTGAGANPTPTGWSIDLVYVPLSRDGSTIQDGYLFWTGTNATNPSPVGLRIVSGVLTAYFYEGGSTLRTISGATIPSVLPGGGTTLNLFNERGKRIRIQLRCGFNGGTSSYLFTMTAFVEGTASGYSGNTTVGSSVSGLVASSATEWSFGRHLTSFAYPFTFTANSEIAGVIDDIRVVRNGASSWGFSNNSVFSPVTSLQIGTGAYASDLIGLLRLNEGNGNSLTIDGSSATSTAYVYPESSEGVFWDHGLVEPYVPAEIRGIYDFRRFSADISADPERTVLVCAGTGLYRVDMDNGDMEPVGGGISKGGLATMSAYEGELIISARNAKRPRLWNGSDTFALGIEAGVAKMAAVTQNTSGSLTDQTYYLYYTYMDNRGRESNPGPGFQFTISSGGNNGRITGFQLPISRDPQVVGRRVYLSGPYAAADAVEGGAAFRVHTQDDNTTQAITGLTIDSVPTTNSLEYFDNGPAPAGGTVRVFNDRTFVGGGSEHPTRVYFSQPTRITQFDQVDDYVNLDSDSGDPVIALVPRANVLAAYTRDRRADLWVTGLAADPVDWGWANSSTGCVSPQAALEFGRGHIFMGERSIVFTDGYNDRSLSSPPRTPPGEPNPSIEKFLREDLNTSRLDYVSMAFHRHRDQTYIALASSATDDSSSKLDGRNDTVVVINHSRNNAISRYDLRAEVLAEIEDKDDQSWIYAGIQGHLCRLDDPDKPTVDGLSAAQGGLASGSSSDGTSLTDSGGFSGDLKGYDFWFYDISANTVVRRVVAYNNANTAYFYDALPTTPATNDLWGVGMFQFYGDFLFGTRRQGTRKRPRWLTVAARSSSDGNNLQVVVAPDMVDKSPTWTTRTTFARVLDAQSGQENIHYRFPLPYLARSWRIRVSDTLLTEALVALGSRPATPVPGNYKTEILEIGVEYEHVGAR